MEPVTVTIDGVTHSGNFTQDFVDGIMAACIMKYYDEESAQEHVKVVAPEDWINWDTFMKYTLGPAYPSMNLSDVRDIAGLNHYIQSSIDDIPFQEAGRYVAELNYTTVEIGGWERVNTESDILTFDELDFIKGVKTAFEWLNRPTGIEVLDTSNFTMVDV